MAPRDDRSDAPADHDRPDHRRPADEASDEERPEEAVGAGWRDASAAADPARAFPGGSAKLPRLTPPRHLRGAGPEVMFVPSAFRSTAAADDGAGSQAAVDEPATVFESYNSADSLFAGTRPGREARRDTFGDVDGTDADHAGPAAWSSPEGEFAGDATGGDSWRHTRWDDTPWMAADDPDDPYVVLGASPRMTWDEIARAHRDLVAELHPDRFIDADDEVRAAAEERVRRVNDAYATIRRERARRGA